jgi:hypothetical protein
MHIVITHSTGMIQSWCTLSGAPFSHTHTLSYPLYGENFKPDRTASLAKIPKGTRVLCISGTTDEFLNRKFPQQPLKGEELLRAELTVCPCFPSTTIKMLDKVGHTFVILLRHTNTNTHRHTHTDTDTDTDTDTHNRIHTTHFSPCP